MSLVTRVPIAPETSVAVDPGVINASPRLMSAAARYGPVGTRRMRPFRIGTHHLGTMAQELSS